MMNKKFLRLFTLAAFAGVGAITPIYADDTPLAEEMDELSGSLKGLRKAETYADKVKLVQAAQGHTINSLKYLPAIFKDISDAKEKALATADYKRLIGLSYAALCELEEAYLKEDDEKAKELLKNLKKLKKEAHKKYTE